jgi:diguanylate cyclase (GGDEF)-like protein
MFFLAEFIFRRLFNHRLSLWWCVPLILVDVSLLSGLIYLANDLGIYLSPLYVLLIIAYGKRIIRWHLLVVISAAAGFAVMAEMSEFWQQNDILSMVVFFVIVIPSMIFLMLQDTKKMATFDPLTGLPNRSLFRVRLEQVIKGCGRNGKKAALLYMDLDGFKEVNDTLGHDVGDQLLKNVAERMRNSVKEKDIIARLGGDEFAIILDDIRDQEAPVIVAQKIGKKFDEPYQLDGRLVNVGISIGIAICPDHTSDINDLISFSDAAMYSAKKQKSGYALYSDKGIKSEKENMRLITDLRSAMKEGRLGIVYQPKQNLQTGEIDSVEALVRWEHSELGSIPPARFISLAEDSSLINELSEWVFETALRDCSNWEDRGCSLGVSINVSARNLQNEKLIVMLLSVIEGNKLKPNRVTLEITEASSMTDSDIAIKNLVGLSMMGVNISIDDFGTGHASMIFVQKLPVREIKIDREFVYNMLNNGRDKKIVQSLIHLAHDIGCNVVAEGVENYLAMEKLKEMGCDLAQGFSIAQPMQSDKLLGWITQYNLSGLNRVH